MLVPGLQTASLSRMTSGSNIDYSRVYESLCKCAQEMRDKYSQQQIHTEKLRVKIKATDILLHELKKMPEESATICETILFALKSHAEALQGHEHLLSGKGNTYALLEQTSGLRERHGDTRASLLRYHDLKNKLPGPDTPLSVDQEALIPIFVENGVRTEETGSHSCMYDKRSFPVQDTLNSRLLKNVECCICNNIMNQPREICLKGHLICLECFRALAKQRITTCPKCRNALLAKAKQNIPVERLIGNLQARCCNSTLFNSIECCICKNIMNQPREICPESHLVCLECSRVSEEETGMTNCPECKSTILAEFKQNIPLERLIGNLQVRCCHADCRSIIEISEIKSHLDLCGEEEIECPHKCTDEGTGEVLRMPRKRLADHGKQCSKRSKRDNYTDNINLFLAFSPMNNGEGLPEKEVLEELMGWLRGGEALGVSLFKLATRLYASEGIPDIKKLKQYGQKLSNLFFASNIKPESDNNNFCYLIQLVVLFLSTRKPQYVLDFMDVEHFHQQVADTQGSKLEKLARLLVSYGGQGVSRYLTLNDDHRKALLNLSWLHAPLSLTVQVITDFSPQDRMLYLFFTRNLKAPLDKNQWIHLGLQLNKLASVLKSLNNRRRYLEVIWSVAHSDRDTFLNVSHAECVIAVFPSLSALEKLAESHSPQGLKALLAACIRFKQGTISKEHIKQLFTALLETGLPLYGHRNLPDHFLSGYRAMGESATFIPITPPTETVEKLALHFVAAVMEVLSNMLYHHEANSLKIEQYGGGMHPFPIPGLEIQDKGIKISNWSVDVFLHFLTVTEFPEHYYLSQAQWQKRCTPAVPLYIHRRREARQQREASVPDTTAFEPLPIAALMKLLKSNVPLKPVVWKSFDYHKGNFPGAVHKQLLDKIEKATCKDIPVSLIDYLNDRRAAEALPQSRLSVPTSPSPVTLEETLGKKEQFQRLWVGLSRRTLLENIDIQSLANYKEYMTMEQIVNILNRVNATIEPCKMDQFNRLLGVREKMYRHLMGDPFRVTLGDEAISYLMDLPDAWITNFYEN